MTESLRVVWDESMLAYDFGPGHPLAPVRVELTMRLARELGVLDARGVTVTPVPATDDALLALVHDEDYVEAVRRAGTAPLRTDLARGLGTDDNPVFAGMHEVSSRVVTASVACARAVLRADAEHAVNVSGGLHHAMPAGASGFCVYNDLAVAIAWLLESGVERVAYVDVDVHHGDGVERVFWDDPRVLTVSVHETGRSLFPGTGWAEDVGGSGAEGSAVNLALPPGTGDAGWLRAFHAVVPQVVEAFEPQVLVSQHGCDSHALDPLAHLALSVDAQRASYEAVHDLAHRVTGGRWVAAGGGGYEIVDVVPRAWSHLLGIAAGAPVQPSTAVPAAWADYVTARMGRPAPARMTDGCDPAYTSWSSGYDPADALDRAVMATRRAAFPWLGLDPHMPD
ncbi:MAG: acetoin utilization protein AcuC [Actinomycetota bacterium]|nr:acetoin utilization protein AcuC [Actinomycetota bacterium]